MLIHWKKRTEVATDSAAAEGDFMTDNEIIKALECLHKRILKSSFAKYVTETEIMGLVNALDLINRQKAEIEKLNVELVGMRSACNSYKMHYDNAQTEIERLKRANKEMANEIYTSTRK